MKDTPFLSPLNHLALESISKLMEMLRLTRSVFLSLDTRIRELISFLLLNVALSSVWAIIGKDLMDMYINHNKKSQILGLTSTLC